MTTHDQITNKYDIQTINAELMNQVKKIFKIEYEAKEV